MLFSAVILYPAVALDTLPRYPQRHQLLCYIQYTNSTSEDTFGALLLLPRFPLVSSCLPHPEVLVGRLIRL